MTSPLPNAHLNFHRLAVTTDFSPASACVLPYARAIAERYGSHLHFLHVIDRIDTLQDSESEKRKKQALEDVSKQLHMWNRLEREPVIREEIVLEGDYSEAINKFVQINQIDILLTGTRGSSGLDRLTLGSKAEEILRSVSCPVITVGPEGAAEAERHARFASVLYATDFSSHSLAAVPYVASLTQKFGGRLLALHMVHPDVQSAAERQRIRRRYEKELRALFGQNLSDWVEPVVEFGSLDVATTEIAQLEKVDLIVLGVKGGGAFARAMSHFSQSKTGKILIEAPCPVLTVRGVH